MITTRLLILHKAYKICVTSYLLKLYVVLCDEWRAPNKIIGIDDENFICQLMGAILTGFGTVEMAKPSE